MVSFDKRPKSQNEYLPSYGLQVKVDAYNGLCVTWNILYVHYKLLNPDISSKDLINHINKYVKLDVILKYAKEVKYMLKLGHEYKLKSHVNISNFIISSLHT